MDTSDLAKRMKGYEAVSKTRLMTRIPVICRIDGRSFKTFLKNFERPFDTIFLSSMQDTMKYLCENIPGCMLGYHQSDEISLLLVDYQTYDTSAFFDYEVQKLCSVIASMATLAFNKTLEKRVHEYDEHLYEAWNVPEKYRKYLNHLKSAVNKGAMFDARCFNLSKEEVANYFYWRQDDASRNSIQMVGQTYFSQSELHKKSRSDIQDMLMLQKGINWNNFPTYQKRGSCAIRQENKWVIDKEIPIFKGPEGRAYVERFVYLDEEEKR